VSRPLFTSSSMKHERGLGADGGCVSATALVRRVVRISLVIVAVLEVGPRSLTSPYVISVRGQVAIRPFVTNCNANACPRSGPRWTTIRGRGGWMSAVSRLTIAIFLCAAALGSACASKPPSSLHATPPGLGHLPYSDADVDFMSGMIPHHAQAVIMA